MNLIPTTAMSRRVPTYPYCALQEGHIRVMTVTGASAAAQDSEHDVVVCTLEQVPLAEANPFCALSYVWGGPEKTLIICLDGHEFLVRKNLGLFLRSLRNYFRKSKGSTSFEFELRVWVDVSLFDRLLRVFRDMFRLHWLAVSPTYTGSSSNETLVRLHQSAGSS